MLVGIGESLFPDPSRDFSGASIAIQEALISLGLRDRAEGDATTQQKLDQPGPLEIFWTQRGGRLVADESSRLPLLDSLNRLPDLPPELEGCQLFAHATRRVASISG